MNGQDWNRLSRLGWISCRRTDYKGVDHNFQFDLHALTDAA
jgi:hypothetical protein